MPRSAVPTTDSIQFLLQSRGTALPNSRAKKSAHASRPFSTTTKLGINFYTLDVHFFDECRGFMGWPFLEERAIIAAHDTTLCSGILSNILQAMLTLTESGLIQWTCISLRNAKASWDSHSGIISNYCSP